MEIQPSPLGRGWPAADGFFSRGGSGEGWLPWLAHTSLLKVCNAPRGRPTPASIAGFARRRFWHAFSGLGDGNDAPLASQAAGRAVMARPFGASGGRRFPGTGACPCLLIFRGRLAQGEALRSLVRQCQEIEEPRSAGARDT